VAVIVSLPSVINASTGGETVINDIPTNSNRRTDGGRPLGLPSDLKRTTSNLLFPSTTYRPVAWVVSDLQISR
jgi:hypothetical protein